MIVMPLTQALDILPLTQALDILQGENNCFHGMILPTLESMIIRTLQIKKDVSRMTSGLPDVIVEVHFYIQIVIINVHSKLN